MKIQIEAYRKKLNIKNIILVVSIILIIGISTFGVIFFKHFIILNENSFENNVKQEKNVEEEQKVSYIPNMSAAGLENIKHIYSSDKKIAYLTFDDGPSNDVTGLILDVLKENKVKATFFVLGTQVEKYPGVIKREYDEGHYIGNHGYSHVYKKIYDTPQAVLEEYNKTNETIAKALNIKGYATHLFRFPGGAFGGSYDSIKEQARQLLSENKVAYLDWNTLTRDSEGKFTKEQLLQNFKLTVRGQKSIVILCHDAAGKILTYEVLPDIIKYLKDDGYEFGDMRDLIK